jgi:hypothetical protein
MSTQQEEGVCGEAMSPHLRQRVAFIAALIPDSNSANWSAISDTWDDLSRETNGTAFEEQVQSLHEPILRKDANALGQAIDALIDHA